MRGLTIIRYGVVAAVVGTAVSAGISAGSASGSTPATPGTPDAAHTVVLRYSFDQAVPLDESGHAHTLTTQAVRGGTLRPVAHGTGLALEFPPTCTGRACPRVVLRTGNADDLNPGSAPFRYGASVLLPKKRTTGGQNVLQKGYSATGGQYKLQIDGRAGRPSCVLVDAGRPRIHLARSRVTVADGAWHQVECRRSGPSLSILVDGVVRGTATVPAALSVSTTAPVSIGGKGAYADNDQFHGTVDDVWISRA